MTAGQRYFLEFEAVEPKPTLFVNGKKICTHIHPTLPLVADVTDYLRAGANELHPHCCGFGGGFAKHDFSFRRRNQELAIVSARDKLRRANCLAVVGFEI